MAGSLGSASINAFNRTTAAFRGIRARLVASCQGSTLSSGKCGKDCEPRSVLIFANQGAEEIVELRPDQWRQRGMGHIARPSFSLRDAVTCMRCGERLLNRSFQIRHSERLLNEHTLRT